MTPTQPWDPTRARNIIAAHVARPGAALPILHALQAEFGCVPPDAIPLVADALNLSRAEIHGLISFYHDFREHPPGKRVLRLCRAEACQAMGAAVLADALLARHRVAWGETTADGALTIEPVYCLGLCATAPAALLDGAPLGRLDAASLDAALTA